MSKGRPRVAHEGEDWEYTRPSLKMSELAALAIVHKGKGGPMPTTERADFIAETFPALGWGEPSKLRNSLDCALRSETTKEKGYIWKSTAEGRVAWGAKRALCKRDLKKWLLSQADNIPTWDTWTIKEGQLQQMLEAFFNQPLREIMLDLLPGTDQNRGSEADPPDAENSSASPGSEEILEEQESEAEVTTYICLW